jgi:hypothetical protein
LAQTVAAEGHVCQVYRIQSVRQFVLKVAPTSTPPLAMQEDVMTRQLGPVTLKDSRAVPSLEVVKWEAVRVVVSLTGTVTDSVQFSALAPMYAAERKIVIATATISPAFIAGNALEVGGF